MAGLWCHCTSAFLLQAFLALGVSSAWSTDRQTPFLARSRVNQPPSQLWGLVVHQSANPAPSPGLPPPFPILPASPAPAAVAPVAPVAAPALPVVDCTGVCEQAKKMWKETEETQQLAIELDKNRTAARIKAEADAIVEDVTLKVHTQGLNDLKALQGHVGTFLDSRVQAFNTAVGNRHNQVVANKAANFGVLKAHQGQLLESLTAGVVAHGYAVAKSSVEQAATTAGVKFNTNPKVHQALDSIKQSGQKWAATYHTAEVAAEQGYNAWRGAYHELDGPWTNVTDTFETANRAARAARGLGPDTRWANEIVRVAGDVTQAGQNEAQKEAASADLSFEMAEKADAVVKGNSGSIVTLTDMLDQAESMANAAAVAR